MSVGAELVGSVDPSVVNPRMRSRPLRENMLHHAHSRIHTHHGDRAKRLEDMLKIADRLGYPKNWDMYYYARPAVHLYVKWESAQPDEDKMGASSETRQTYDEDRKIPFDGDTGSPQFIPWRIYPFRDSAKLCMGKDPDGCAAVDTATVEAPRRGNPGDI